PATSRSVVDFPQPDGPTNTTSSPLSTSRSSSCSAADSVPLYRRDKPRSVTLAIARAAAILEAFSAARHGHPARFVLAPRPRPVLAALPPRQPPDAPRPGNCDALFPRPRPFSSRERHRQRLPRVARYRHERPMDCRARGDSVAPNGPAARLHPVDEEQGLA